MINKPSCNNYVHRSTTILVSMFIHFGARTQTMARGPIKEKASCNNFVHGDNTILVSMFIRFGAWTYTMVRSPTIFWGLEQFSQTRQYNSFVDVDTFGCLDTHNGYRSRASAEKRKHMGHVCSRPAHNPRPICVQLTYS